MRHFFGAVATALFCGSVLCVAGGVAFGQIQAPAGYQVIPLVDSSNQPFSPDGLAMSSTGELAVTNGSTVTLYNTWQNGRTAVASATDSSWGFDTDPVFLNSSTILFGENSNTDALWEVNFARPTPTITQITANNSLPAVEGVALISPTTALVSGTTASFGGSGGLYLDTVNLTQTSNNVTPVQQNVGSGYVGESGVSPAGAELLLEDSISGPSLVHYYEGANTSAVSLANGNGYGAYGITFDSAGIAYVTTGDTITAIAGIDSSSPVVSQFAVDPATAANGYFPFLTSISFTGGGFDPNLPLSEDTGALIFTDADAGQSYAIIVPEPTSIGILALCAAGLMRRKTR
jgi:hypothetical protein